MVQKPPLPHLAQHYAEKNQQLPTKQVLILRLDVIVDDRLGVGELPPWDVCQVEGPKFRLRVSIHALVRGVIANATSISVWNQLGSKGTVLGTGGPTF